MGRGLSDLQRWIVDEARKRKRLYYADICVGYYGWIARPKYGGGPNSQKFSPDEIGRAEYARVMATISRSCARLEARGLVHRIQGAYSPWQAVKAVSVEGGGTAGRPSDDQGHEQPKAGEGG